MYTVVINPQFGHELSKNAGRSTEHLPNSVDLVGDLLQLALVGAALLQRRVVVPLLLAECPV